MVVCGGGCDDSCSECGVGGSSGSVSGGWGCGSDDGGECVVLMVVVVVFDVVVVVVMSVMMFLRVVHMVLVMVFMIHALGVSTKSGLSKYLWCELQHLHQPTTLPGPLRNLLYHLTAFHCLPITIYQVRTTTSSSTATFHFLSLPFQYILSILLFSPYIIHSSVTYLITTSSGIFTAIHCLFHAFP